MKSARKLVTFEFYAPEGRNAPPDGDDPWAGRLTGKPVSRDELLAYIAVALESWGGQHHPADPLFDGITPLRLKLVTVRSRRT